MPLAHRHSRSLPVRRLGGRRPGWQDHSIATLADPDDNYFQLMTPMPVPAAG